MLGKLIPRVEGFVYIKIVLDGVAVLGEGEGNENAHSASCMSGNQIMERNKGVVWSFPPLPTAFA